jgi:hypothetical protein
MTTLQLLGVVFDCSSLFQVAASFLELGRANSGGRADPSSYSTSAQMDVESRRGAD